VEFEASPITAFLEASATAVGVGMVLGGFAVGLAGVLMHAPRDQLERGVFKAGYIAAAFCLAMRWADIMATI
jgi:hypothetical protein